MIPHMLYNVTFDVYDDSSILVPRVPTSAGDDEDKITPRVCFADSIRHCIEAIGPCNRDLHEGSTFIVRMFCTDYANTNSIITPITLFTEGKVPDALETQEYWYLKEAIVARCKYIVRSFEVNRDLAWSCIQLEDVKRIASSYQHVPSNIDKFTTAESLYNYCMQFYQDNKFYDLEDLLFDDLSELPWAQHTSFDKLVIERLR